MTEWYDVQSHPSAQTVIVCVNKTNVVTVSALTNEDVSKMQGASLKAIKFIRERAISKIAKDFHPAECGQV